MKRLYSIVLIGFLFSSALLLGQSGMVVKKYNLSTINPLTKVVTNELEKLTPDAYKSHPEYGIKPFNAPCTDCIELVDRRTEYSRYYVTNGSNGTEFYQEQGYSALNYKDANGNWLSVDIRLKPTNQPHLYSAPAQNLPVSLDAGLGFTTINRAGAILKFNNKIELIWVNNGVESSLGTANWDNYVVGDEGAKVVDAWPGIDIELKVYDGKVKSDFVIKQQLSYTSGKLILRDHLELPVNYRFAGVQVNQPIIGDFSINTVDGTEAFKFTKAFAWDGAAYSNSEDLAYVLSDENYLDVEIPVSWLNAPGRQYPVTVDPLVSGTNTLPIGSIAGSGYNATCGIGGCAYNLTVPVPANCTVTDMLWTFNYIATGGCNMISGALDLRLGGCRFPSNPGLIWGCGVNNPGTCTTNNQTVFNELDGCLPAPQCASYNLPFTMNFYRCASPGACSNTCIAAGTAWTMTVQGRTVQTTSVSGAQVICQGQQVNLNAAGNFGVGPYSVVWNPGGLSGSPITVSPNVTTPYTVTVTDACGQIATQTVNVNVNTVTNPGFTINPATICPGGNVTLTGLGVAPLANYDWQTPGANPVSVNNLQNATINYANAGTYNVTLNYNSSGCFAPVTQQVTVNPNVVPTALISVNPAMPVCANTPLTLSAVITNGGANPIYNWKVNGVSVGNGTTYSTSSYNNGDVVTLELTSNANCALPATVTSNTITIQVTAVVTPSVSITANPAGQICAGTSVTFTATPTNGGGTPTYQWKINGGNVGGNSATYTSAALTNGDQVSVVMTPSLTCISQATATSNIITMTVVLPVIPSVSITQSPVGAICAGTNVTFTATPTNGGVNPSYQWSLNGAPVGSNSATYSNNTLQNGDFVTVTLTSNATCAQPLTATSNQISMAVNPVITPTVSIAVSPVMPVCSGTNLTFTATPLNAGVNPNYQWKLNGVNVGTNSNTYASTALANGDIVSVVLTSTYVCANPTTATSNAITVQINPVLVPSVGIVANPSGAICAGTNVTFTASPTNGGTAPAYQWTVNGTNAGINSASFSSNTLTNGDVIAVTLTSSEWCANPTTAASNTITMTVNPVLVPSVTIIDNPQGQQCSGTPITFTATPVNPGNNPTYQWQVNGANVGTNALTYTNNTPTNGDVVTVVLTSNATCVSPTTAISNGITLNILPTVVPAISFTANQTMPVCDGTAISYTAAITGGGNNPTYQWYVNGVAATGATTPTFNNPAVNNDIITVELVSDAPCANPTTIVSAPFTVQTQPYLTPTVSITSNPSGTICVGQTVTFTASPVNGGVNPSYQWFINGNAVGPNADVFITNAILPGDVVELTMTSNYTCLNIPTANSNLISLQINPPITVVINSVPDNICAYETAVLTAVASGGDGGPYIYTWDNGETGSTIAVSPDFTQTYTVSAVDQCGTTPGTATATITVKITPVAQFTYAPDSALTTLDDINFDNNSFNANWWTWYFGDGDVLDTTDMPIHNFILPGIYDVKLVVTSPDGCEDSTVVKINIRDQSLFYIPNAFTPDANGLNELFKVYTWNINVPMELAIYARNGEMVYNSLTDNPNGGVYWTGQKHNTGDLLPDGVYVYYLYIDAPYLNKKRRLTRGTVTLIR